MRTISRVDGLVTLVAVHLAIPAIAQTAQPGSEGGDQEMKVGEGTEIKAPDSKRRKSVVLEEVVVTAQKREESLQDVPISIAVLGGAELDTSTLQDANEVLMSVPGVSRLHSLFGNASMLVVRGVAGANAFNSGGATAAYYLDTLPFGFVKTAFGPDTDVYDLDRIEVLRGPQGTLYGASALNGVVRVLTRDANLNEFELKARGLTSSTENGGWGYRGDTAINVPVIDGKLAARAVVGYESQEGWIDRPNNRDANDLSSFNARLKVNAQPTEQLSIGASAWISRADYDAPPNGEGDVNSSLVNEPIANDYNTFGLKIGYELPWLSITSTTSYIDYTNRSLLDLTAIGLPAMDELRIEADTFAQEVLFSSRTDGVWRWHIGGMYRDSEDLYSEFLPELIPTPDATLNTSKSYAAFGEVTRRLADGKFEITAGLRYFEDDVGLREKSSFSGAPPEELVRADDTFDSVTPRVVLTWHADEQLTAYASYSEGFRSGVLQAPVVLRVAPLPPAKPDKLKNYELGGKGSLFGGVLGFDAAVYYMDWLDVQQSITVRYQGNPFSGVVNSESASGLGVDLGMTARPIDALELTANLSWNDLTFDEDVFSGGVVRTAKGERTNFSPEYTASTAANYLFQLGGSGFTGQLSASMNYTSPTVDQEITGGVFSRVENDSLWIGRVSLMISAADHWRTTLFVDNVNNERASTIASPSVPDWATRMRPRTTGLQLDYTF